MHANGIFCSDKRAGVSDMSTRLVLVVVLPCWKTAAASEAFSGQEQQRLLLLLHTSSTRRVHVQTVQWLVNALVTDDVKKAGDRPPT